VKSGLEESITSWGVTGAYSPHDSPFYFLTIQLSGGIVQVAAMRRAGLAKAIAYKPWLAAQWH